MEPRILVVDVDWCESEDVVWGCVARLLVWCVWCWWSETWLIRGSDDDGGWFQWLMGVAVDIDGLVLGMMVVNVNIRRLLLSPSFLNVYM